MIEYISRNIKFYLSGITDIKQGVRTDFSTIIEKIKGGESLHKAIEVTNKHMLEIMVQKNWHNASKRQERENLCYSKIWSIIDWKINIVDNRVQSDENTYVLRDTNGNSIWRHGYMDKNQQ